MWLGSPPIGQELQAPDELRRAEQLSDKREPPNTFAYRELLLSDQDDAGMGAARSKPLRVKPSEVAEVTRYGHPPFRRGEAQVFGIGCLQQPRFDRNRHVDAVGEKCSHQLGVA